MKFAELNWLVNHFDMDPQKVNIKGDLDTDFTIYSGEDLRVNIITIDEFSGPRRIIRIYNSPSMYDYFSCDYDGHLGKSSIPGIRDQ